MRPKKRFVWLFGLSIFLGAFLLSCSEVAVDIPPRMASAEMLNADGKTIGSAHLVDLQDGVQLDLRVSGLEPGPHGFHIHESGECEPPDFQSAGGHFNPAGNKHGFEVEGGPHAGDLRNLEVSSDGEVEVERTVDGVSLGDEEAPSLVGKAIVIHAAADDYKSQPAGDAGSRVACGVIQLDTTQAPTQPYSQLTPRDFSGENPGKPVSQ